ncbi:MAG: hypothetical protein ABIC40_06825, partial [bacterium]
ADALGANDDLTAIHGTPLDDETGRGVFTAGESNTRRYRIKFPMNPGPEIVFGYAIDASWAASNPNPPSEVPDDFPINANQPEPYDLVLTPTLNTLFYDSESGIKGGVLYLTADVYDWQGQNAGNIASEINIVRAYAPGLTGNSTDGILLGENSTSAQYSIELTGLTEISQTGKEILAVRAEALGATYDQGLSFPAPTSKISSWQEILVDVADPECVADSNNSMLDADTITPFKKITDTMCDSVDDTDWYFFDIPVNFKAQGTLRWFVDAVQASFELYDVNAVQVAASSSAGPGVQVLELDTLDLDPGTYFIRLYVSQFSIAGPGTLIYLLEPDFEIVNAAPLNPVDITPDYLDADLSWVERDGNYVFGAGLAGYWVYDVTNISNPTFVSRIHDTCGVEPAFEFPYLYAWEDQSDDPVGIDLVDFSDPSNPILHEDVLVLDAPVGRIVMDPKYLYIVKGIGLNWFVEIYDYSSDPTSPVWINEFEINTEPVNDIRLVDPQGPNTALIVLQSGNVLAFDVEDPLNVVMKSGIASAVGYERKHLKVSGQFMLETWVHNGVDYGVSVLAYSPIFGLDSIGNVQYSGTGSNVTILGSKGYIANGSTGITVIDFSSPSDPVVGEDIPAVSDATYVHAEDDALFCVTEHSGFQVYDLSVPNYPVMTGFAKCLNVPIDGTFAGDFGIFSQFKGSYCNLTFLDLADIGHPVNVSKYPYFLIPVFNMSCLGNIMASSGGNNYLMLMNTDALPDTGFSLLDDLLSPIASIVLSETRCYAWLVNGTIHVYDTSAFPTVSPVGTIGTALGLWGTVVSGDYLYGYNNQNIIVYSLANIDSPSYVKSVSAGHPIRELIVRKNILYAGTMDTLEIFDLSDPTTPSRIKSVDFPYVHEMRFFAVDGQYVYASDDDHPTIAVNVWPSNDPVIFGDVTAPSTFLKKGLLINDGVLYELFETIGLKMYDLY